MTSNRIHTIDALRGLAILGMIFYHFLFDLNWLNIASVDLSKLGWVVFARIVQFLFLVLVGISTYLIFEKYDSENFIKKQFDRVFKVGLSALTITFVTKIIFPDQYIGFGILHLITVSIVVLTFLARLKRGTHLALAILIIAVFLFTDQLVDFSGYSWLGYYDSSFNSLDYFPIVPWLSVPLIGFYIGPRIFGIKRYDDIWPKWILFLGKKSLIVYLVHQPILIGLLMIFISI